MRTRLSVCRRKLRFAYAGEAMAAARLTGLDLRHYRCERCNRFHLTSRRKGKRLPRPVPRQA
jgi:hypothetical protein